MGKYMKHMNETELIEHYYKESSNMAERERHLAGCAACARSYAELRRDLDGVKPLAPPARDEGYVEQVWQSIRRSLPVYERPKRSWTLTQLWRPLGWAVACLLIAVAFFAGRQWERRQMPAVAVAGDPHARQRVVIVVLGDHLDRSERLLVELNHAGSDVSGVAMPLRSEARELLATNRLVRQSAIETGDVRVEASLDRLERLLSELANEPDALSGADLDRLRQEMNTDSLLFDIRVLRSRVNSQATEPQGAGKATKGASI